ncbi:MAG: hypothetical protein Q8O37_16385 [Sulfuricellaceae bacterium]|nr:hypothetical protein [Sulfuricellaceae bacterium]
MANHPSPTLQLTQPAVAALPEPFTLNDVMSACGLSENTTRASLNAMKARGWIEPAGKLYGKAGQRSARSLWARTSGFGQNITQARKDAQTAGLNLLGECMTGWRK